MTPADCLRPLPADRPAFSDIIRIMQSELAFARKYTEQKKTEKLDADFLYKVFPKAVGIWRGGACFCLCRT